METLTQILRAAHCKSTHHFFALDALEEVHSDEGKKLVALLLANYQVYLQGAKDPDNIFKDFENHVLHVTDGYWGGATRACQKWLDTTYRMLQSQKWKEAAYAIGVLSHYFTDPFMPLHTAQSNRESVVHRPLEWSVCCAYAEIYEMAYHDHSLASFELIDTEQWIQDAVLRGATLVNPDYDPIIDDYSVIHASSRPKEALGSKSKQRLARIFVLVLTGWGRVLDRIASECGIAIPEFPLNYAAILAGIQVPKQKLLAKMESAEQRKAAERILDEFLRTGKVLRNLPLEQTTVRRVREKRPELKPAPEMVERAKRHLAQSSAPSPRKPIQATQDPPAIANRTDDLTPIPKSTPIPVPIPIPVTPVPIESAPETPLPDEPSPAHSIHDDVSDDLQHSQDPSPPTSEANSPTIDQTVSSSKRKQLEPNDPIVDAPAIGPKTAARLQTVACHKVSDLLQADPQQLAKRLKTKWITPALISEWQSQARLACQIERLPAVGAGLLVMAGIHDASQMHSLSAEELHAMLVEVANTTTGKRLLRDKPPPPLKTVQNWLTASMKAIQLT